MRSTAITSALINKLAADTALMALTPDGVFKNVARKSVATAGTAKRFVIVSLVISTNVPQFGGRAFQEALYLVEARMLSSSGGDVNAAAAQIDALLDGGTLNVANYALMAMEQVEATEETEFDESDPSLQWDRAGGRYAVVTSPS